MAAALAAFLVSWFLYDCLYVLVVLTKATQLLGANKIGFSEERNKKGSVFDLPALELTRLAKVLEGSTWPLA